MTSNNETLAEVAANCAWCEREYGEVDNARA